MPTLRTFQIKGLNLRVNPFLQENGELLRAVNVDTDFIGAKVKRPGYTKFLGTPENSQVTTIFDWHRESGTQFWLYRMAAGKLYYSTQGTGAWTICGNGTFTNNAYLGHSILEDVLIVGDGTAVTRHSTNGTSFSNTTGAPRSNTFTQYQQRIWASGTSSDVFFSTTGTASDWTTDSSSIKIPGAGKVTNVFTQNNRLIAAKNSGAIFKYDGNDLYDLATKQGPSSPLSIGDREDYRIWLNRDGIQLFDGLKPQVISSAVERLFYNAIGSSTAGTQYDNAPGAIHRYDYFVTLGTVTDDFTGETISNAVLKYNFLTNEFLTWSMAAQPTAWHSFLDNNRNQQLLFGDSNGQVYQMDFLAGTAQSDAGTPIQSVMEGVLHYGEPENDKEFERTQLFFNPGAQAKTQTAISDTFTKGQLRWFDLGDVVNGHVDYRFNNMESNRGKLRFWKVYEASMSSPFRFYGFSDDVRFVQSAT